MDGMLPTIGLILATLAFGAILQRTGMLDRIVAPAVNLARSKVSRVATAVASAIAMNVVAGDQYLAVMLPGRTFKDEFACRGLPGIDRSRAIADSGIVTAPIVPWNDCGALMAAALGAATLDLLAYAFLNLLSPLITILAAFLVGRGGAELAVQAYRS